MAGDPSDQVADHIGGYARGYHELRTSLAA
jgi:hypothetical protein